MFLSVMITLSSCMETKYVTRKSDYDKVIDSINNQMTAKGFSINGSSSGTRNEAIVAGVSYSKYTGYGTAMANKFITQDTYKFTDTLGNTMNYSVLYLLKQSNDGVSYVEDIEICGCETSNPQDYNELCGNQALINRIKEIPKDQQIQVLSTGNTIVAVAGVTSGVLIVLLMWMLNRK